VKYEIYWGLRIGIVILETNRTHPVGPRGLRWVRCFF